MEFDIKVALEQERNDSTDFKNLFNIGLYYFKKNKMNDSIRYLERIANIDDPMRGKILFQLAMSYEKIDIEKGRQILDEALEINPEFEANLYMGSRKHYGV